MTADPAAPPPTRREDLLTRLETPGTWDLVVIGGGATGLGVALDAAARGLRVALLESHDFGKGTSSRATKLVHGGVRYLAQGNIRLVREALHERTTLLRNAPHLARPLPFVVPSYRTLDTPFYGLGLKMYDVLAGAQGLGSGTRMLGAAETLAALPTLRAEGLRGGVEYWDGQFDDARLAVVLARTAAAQGALVVNHCEVTGLLHEGGKVAGVAWRDAETGRQGRLHAACVVNATGVWVDALRRQDAAAEGRPWRPVVAPSQGVHLVVDRDFLPADHALMIPKTADGRVLFAVPWLGKLILGTTDTPRPDLPREPRPFPAEIDFILGEAGRYLVRAPAADDIRSVWVGLRPLVRPAGDEPGETKALSREHAVLVSGSGLVTVTGGKWTTYRAMAEDVLARCAEAGLIPPTTAGRTRMLPLAGAGEGTVPQHPGLAAPWGLHLYGTDAAFVESMPGAGRAIGGGLTEGMVRFAVRHEFARTVEDVLARRSRVLFLDAALAASLAGPVAAILAEETGRAVPTTPFQALAADYATPPPS